VAVLLSQVGGAGDAPDLRRLIEADLIRYREVQEARRQGDHSGDQVGYVMLYIAAVTNADPEHADEVLLELLREPEYERFVSEALVRRARKSEGPATLKVPAMSASGKLIASANLSPEAGKLMHTPRAGNSHHTWWAPAGYDHAAAFQVVD
jgi:hypothetical protein